MASRDEIADAMATAGVGAVGTYIKKTGLPASPNECAAIVEYPGMRPEHVFGQAGIAIEHPQFQLLFRGEPNDYATPRAKAEIAYRYFANIANQVLNTTRYLNVEPKQPPFKLEHDQNERYVIAFNLETAKELSA